MVQNRVAQGSVAIFMNKVLQTAEIEVCVGRVRRTPHGHLSLQQHPCVGDAKKAAQVAVALTSKFLRRPTHGRISDRMPKVSNPMSLLWTRCGRTQKTPPKNQFEIITRARDQTFAAVFNLCHGSSRFTSLVDFECRQPWSSISTGLRQI